MFLPKNRLFSRVIPGILLVFSLLVMGCPGTTGSPTLEPPDNGDGKGNGTGNGTGTGTGDGSGKTPAELAEGLADLLNGSLDEQDHLVKYADAIVTVLKDFNVDPSADNTRAVASDNIRSLTVPSGVTFVIPAGKTITVQSGGTITTPGTIDVAGTLETGGSGTVSVTGSGAIKVEQRATLKAATDSTVSVAGTGTITLEANATLSAASGSTVSVTGSAKVEVKASAILEAASGSTVSVTGSAIVDLAGTLKAESGSTVTVATLNANGGTVEAAAADTVIVTTVKADTVESAEKVVSKVTVGNTVTVGGSTATTLAPILKSTVVSYGTSNAVSVMFTFDKAVTVTSSTDSSGTLSNESKTVTVTPTNSPSGTAKKVELTVSADSKTTSVEKTVIPVENGNLPTSGTYSVVSYDADVIGSTSVVVLKENNNTKGYLVTDTTKKDLFNAIYTPNAPKTTDAIESGKTTVAYTEAISTAALALFQIDLSTLKVNVKGTALPTGGSTTNPIVIDIGLPGTDNATANATLPTFYIPVQELGAQSGDYKGVRLRVNKGASLVILANNSGYINTGISDSNEAGYFNYGCVEVMAGGELRDGGYQGFPLGSNAVILNRAGSYLSIGPEPGSADATAEKVKNVYDTYFAGYLIGPVGKDARIEWDNTNTTGYLESRPNKVAFSGNVTVKKVMGLIYSAWFIGDTTLTIAENASLAPNGASFKFYGTSNQAKIVVKKGGTIGCGFLVENSNALYTAASVDVRIQNNGSSSTSVPYTETISGTQAWTGLDGLTDTEETWF
jgi:hypothetical protein